jgi:hypothetical protein
MVAHIALESVAHFDRNTQLGWPLPKTDSEAKP